MKGLRVLVVDDDAITLRFFEAALREIGVDVRRGGRRRIGAPAPADGASICC